MIKFPKTFMGGLIVPDYKDSTSNKPIEEMSLPKKVIIPLKSYGGISSEALVGVGDRVKTGQLVARSEKFISAPQHASISGTITKIANLPHPVLKEAESIIIESDGKDQKAFSLRERDYKNLSEDEIRTIIKDAGLVGMGGGAFPTHVKFNIPNGENIDSYIINLCECEPYLTVDYRLGLERADEILKGIDIALKALAAKYAYVGIENNKKEVIKLLNDKAVNYPQIKIVSLKSKYPQGEEKQLIRAVLGRIVPSGKLPLHVGVVVNNIQTVLAIYEAVCWNKPLYERVITVNGEGIREPKNLKVRLGTPARDVIRECGGITSREVEIIFGGPMMGKAVDDLRSPILKGTSGIVVLPREKIDLQEERPCIRCGKCIDVCPMALLPTELNKLIEYEQWDVLDDFYISQCIECGSCSYICPSKIPIVERIKRGKEVLSKKVNKNK